MVALWARDGLYRCLDPRRSPARYAGLSRQDDQRADLATGWLHPHDRKLQSQGRRTRQERRPADPAGRKPWTRFEPFSGGTGWSASRSGAKAVRISTQTIAAVSLLTGCQGGQSAMDAAGGPAIAIAHLM